MNVLLTGINHKTAPVEMREMLAIEPGRLTDATRVLLSVPGVEEAMILSTCNRVEVLAFHRANGPDLLGFLGDFLGVNTSGLRHPGSAKGSIRSGAVDGVRADASR
jgi:glutamyl-tRNA reductase